jgi:hypothetical protein
MQAFLANWKTTATGAAILAIAALHTFAGLNIPGALDFSAALPVALGLMFASDATK